MKKLNGARNQCPTCREYFNSNGAFDKHRTGSHGVNRRCRTIEEMLDKGMALREDGFWVAEPMNADLIEQRNRSKNEDQHA
jgi:hypothetical protein